MFIQTKYNIKKKKKKQINLEQTIIYDKCFFKNKDNKEGKTKEIKCCTFSVIY